MKKYGTHRTGYSREYPELETATCLTVGNSGRNVGSSDDQLTKPVFHFQALVYRDGNLVSGSLEALVQHMVPTEEYYPDRAYLFAFLLSARLFIKPHELLGEVCALCEHQQNLNGEGGKVSPRIQPATKAHREPSGRALYGHRVHYRFIVSQARPPFRIHPLGESPWHARSRSTL